MRRQASGRTVERRRPHRRHDWREIRSEAFPTMWDLFLILLLMLALDTIVGMVRGYGTNPWGLFG